MDNLRHLPTPLTRRIARVDALCRAIAHDGPRPLLNAREYDGQILVMVGGVEEHVSREEFRRFCEDGLAMTGGRR
jgi:hypothetical protein